jgi:adenylylsulfate kinase
MHAVSREDREKLNGHRGCVVWFTGLSGSGKSTVANAVDQLLHARGIRTFLLDGDNVRHGLNASPEKLREEFGEEYAQRFGLTFGPEDRKENIRRIGNVAQLFASAGIIVLTAFVSPYRADRDAVRKLITDGGRNKDFIEVFVDAPIEVCEQRDPKGFWKQARAGKIKNFTGISDPYEPPVAPELTLAAGTLSPDLLAAEVVRFLENSGKIPRKTGESS